MFKTRVVYIYPNSELFRTNAIEYNIHNNFKVGINKYLIQH